MTSLCGNSFVSYMNDWHHQELSDFDLFQDMPLTLPSLDGSSSNSSGTTTDHNTDYVSVNLEPFLLEDSDNFIKNHDCMWSGNTSPVSSHSSSSQFSKSSSSSSSSNQLSTSTSSSLSLIKIKDEKIDPAYTAITRHLPAQAVLPDPTKPNYINTTKQIKQERSTNTSKVTIAPGMSLLKKNQPAAIKKELLSSFSSPPPSSSSTTSSFSSSSYESMSGRPDTPFSLDDEVKHAVDFYSCSIGSNNIPLEPFDKSSYIKDIRKQLEDPTTVNISLPGHRNRTMSIIDEVIRDNITDESDTEDDDDDEEEEEVNSMTIPIRHPKMKIVHSSKYISPATQTQSDHSYSRSKYGAEEINYETPIESDEEIDVVNLPTNPSEKDRRALQSKMEYEIRKSNNSLRRRISYDPSYTPQSISPAKSCSSANSRYPSPAQTPKYINSVSGQRKRVSNNAGHIIVNQNVRDDYLPPTAKRHRVNNGGGGGVYGNNGSGNSSSSSSSSKINKKLISSSSMSSASSTTSSCSGSSSPTKQRHLSIDDIDSNEKRNLHNDMERQRRIGLKNLFEALKKQIPSIKDKERAPKVNILREAAKLCDHLTCDERDVLRRKQLLKEEIRQRQDRLRRLRAMVR